MKKNKTKKDILDKKEIEDKKERFGLTEKQVIAMDLIVKEFKDSLREAKIDSRNWDVISNIREEEEDEEDFDNRPRGKRGGNHISISGIEVSSTNSSLAEVESTVIRFLEKFKDKIPNYIG